MPMSVQAMARTDRLDRAAQEGGIVVAFEELGEFGPGSTGSPWTPIAPRMSVAE